MNKTAWQQTLLFIQAAALRLLAVLLLPCFPMTGSAPFPAVAWAQSADQSPSQTDPFLPEVLTQPTTTPGTIVSPSAPAATPSKEQEEPTREQPSPAGAASGPQSENRPSPETAPFLPEILTQPTPTAGPAVPLVTAPSTTPEAGEKKQEETTFVDIMHSGISSGIYATAGWLDSFFGDKRNEAELHKSHIRVTYNFFLEQGAPAVLKPSFEYRAVLPQLREKTHLLIWGSPKDETSDFSATKTHTTTSPMASTNERNVTTALQYAHREHADSSWFLGGGMKFSGTKVAGTGGPKYRFQLPFESGWKLRFIEDLAWRTDGPWQARGTLDLERPLPHDLFFRMTAERIDTEHVEGFTYTFECNLRQPLNSQRALEYDWVNIFQTRPVHELMEVDLRVTFRSRVWRDWLFYSVMPQYRFPRDRAFEPTPGILFQLEMLFGGQT